MVFLKFQFQSLNLRNLINTINTTFFINNPTNFVNLKDQQVKLRTKTLETSNNFPSFFKVSMFFFDEESFMWISIPRRFYFWPQKFNFTRLSQPTKFTPPKNFSTNFHRFPCKQFGEFHIVCDTWNSFKWDGKLWCVMKCVSIHTILMAAQMFSRQSCKVWFAKK